jgi:hypothetical protein
VAIVAYLAVAIGSYRSGLLPVRPLYEGTGPPPTYRWVSPPPSLADANQPPAPGEQTIPFRGASQLGTVSTPDGQAYVQLAKGAFVPRAGQTAVKVTIEPRDPSTYGPPSEGLGFEGNAYEVTAVYEPTGQPATLAATTCKAARAQPSLCPLIVLRYPFGATGLSHWDGSAWKPLKPTPVPASLQIFADSPTLGVFVAVGPPRHLTGDSGGKRDLLAVLIGALAVVLLAAFYAARVRPRTPTPRDGRGGRSGRAAPRKGLGRR